MRTVHYRLTTARINDLSAGNVSAAPTTKQCRILHRLYSRISTVFKHQVFYSRYTNVTKQTIKNEMVLEY